MKVQTTPNITTQNVSAVTQYVCLNYLHMHHRDFNMCLLHLSPIYILNLFHEAQLIRNHNESQDDCDAR